jgi:hypothetical protein
MATSACIVQDMAGARVDVPAAISVAGSLGVDPATAAPIIMAAAKGLDEGRAEAREKEEAAKGEG